MKARNTLRNLTLLLVFAVAAMDASATNDPKGDRATAGKATATTVPTGAPRKMAAAFVDPTLPLAALVERERAERNEKNLTLPLTK